MGALMPPKGLFHFSSAMIAQTHYPAPVVTPKTGGIKIRFSLPVSVSTDPGLIQELRRRIKTCLKQAQVGYSAVKATRSLPRGIKIRLSAPTLQLKAVDDLCACVHILVSKLHLPPAEATDWAWTDHPTIDALKRWDRGEPLQTGDSLLLGAFAGHLIEHNHWNAAHGLLQGMNVVDQAVACTEAFRNLVSPQWLILGAQMAQGQEGAWYGLQHMVSTAVFITSLDDHLTAEHHALAPIAQCMNAPTLSKAQKREKAAELHHLRGSAAPHEGAGHSPCHSFDASSSS